MMVTAFEATKTSETREPGAHDGIAGTTERAATDAREVGAPAVGAATQATGTVIGTTRVSEAATRSLAATQTINGDQGHAAGMLGIQGRSLEALANLVGIQMRNLDAFAAAQKAAMQSIGTLAKQQQEIMTASFRSAATLPASLFDGDARDRVTRPIEAVKALMLDNTANSNVMSELAARSSATIAGILQDRMLAALDELKAALLQAIPPTAKA
jgi:hypothetical protein